MPLEGIVYILTNKNKTTLYVGVTRNLQRRIAEHKLHINESFSKRYNLESLVYYEIHDRLDTAVQREKQLKNWHRKWKEALINEFNPTWKDLTDDIGVDEMYLQTIKESYEAGVFVAGSPKA
jgi:putative endonuclease